MNWITFLILAFPHMLLAHDGHQPEASELSSWIGQFHVIFLHFPIAFTYLALVSELIYRWNKDERYNFITTFLLVAAAITAIPTVLAGLEYAESGHYTDEAATLIGYHRLGGISTLIFAFLTAGLKLFGKQSKLYALSFLLLILCVSATAYLGGELTFGPIKLLP